MQQRPPTPGRSVADNASEPSVPAVVATNAVAGRASSLGPDNAAAAAAQWPGPVRAAATAAGPTARAAPAAAPTGHPTGAAVVGPMRAPPPETTIQVLPLETLLVMVMALMVAVGVAAALRLRRRARECDFLVRGNAMRIHAGVASQDPIVEAQGDRPSGGWRRRRGEPVAMVAMVGGAGGEGGGGGGGGAGGGAGADGDDSSYSTTEDAGDDWSGDADDEATGLEARGDAPPAGDGSESVMIPRPLGGQDQDESEVEEAHLDYGSDYIDEQTIENFILALITQQANEKRSGIFPEESSSST